MEYNCNVNSCEYNEESKCTYCGDYWTLNDENCFSFMEKYDERVELNEKRC